MDEKVTPLHKRSQDFLQKFCGIRGVNSANNLRSLRSVSCGLIYDVMDEEINQ